MKKLQASARVRVTLDISVPDRWGQDCPTSQIFKQATESALGELRKITDTHRGTVVGTPVVTMIFVEEER